MKFHIITLLVFLTCNLFSQSGCTDPAASNYNVSAVSNDGSCIYAASTMVCNEKGTLTPYIPESSGVLYLNGAVWTHNDSGNTPDIFKVDTANGQILQRVTIVNHGNTDWEDIAADSLYIYVGDFGNNDGIRTDLKVLRIRRDSIGSGTTATVNATAINFSYSDQTSFTSNGSNNFDCESLISIGNTLYLFSKDRGDFKTRVYRLSKTPGTYVLTPYTTYDVAGEITGADYNPYTHEVVLIGYLSSKKNSFLWFLNDFPGDQFFSGNKRRVEIGNSSIKWQTEGVSYANTKELFISCETSDTPAALYNTYKPFATPVGIKENSAYDKAVKVYPNPAEDLLTIESTEPILDLQLISPDGQLCYQQKSNTTTVLLSIKNLELDNDLYTLRINSGNFIYFRKIVVLR